MRALAPLLLVVTAARAAAEPEDPRAVVREATCAVEDDAAAARSTAWGARLDRDAGDRAAALGLATLARLTYDYPRADALYRRLADAPAPPDRVTAYARL